MNHWDQISKHFKKDVSKDHIIYSLVKQAKDNPDTCSECCNGEPVTKGRVKNLNSINRRCMVGERLEPFFAYARKCPKFQPQTALRLYRLSHPKYNTTSRLAVELDVSKGNISHYEHGRRKMKPETAERYAKILGCTWQDLI